MRISDWSSDVCSSDLVAGRRIDLTARNRIARHAAAELVDTAGDFFFVALAEEVDRRHDQPFAALAHLLLEDAGDQPDIADADLALLSDLARDRDRPAARSRRLIGRSGTPKNPRRPPGNTDHVTTTLIGTMCCENT